jgi:O-antigen ligase
MKTRSNVHCRRPCENARMHDTPSALKPDTNALWISVLVLAVAVPSLLAFNLAPSATFLNQATSLIGWAVVALVLSATTAIAVHRPRGALAAALGALTLILLSAIGSWQFAGLPMGLTLSAIGVIASAMLVLWIAAAVAEAGHGTAAFNAFCIALIVTGVLSTLVGMVQVFAPQWADGQWIATASVPGRASGNLRQPNHLSSLLLWAALASVWMLETGRIKWPLAAALGGLFMLGLVLSASRTGTLGVIVLALWGGLDSVFNKQRSRAVRAMLLLSPLIYALCWWGSTEWARQSHQVFGAAARLTADGDLSSSRFGIWANTLSLIAQHPWFGVGFGEFNFAWSLTPFPKRPHAFFDHTHNLPLQLAVELGLPLTVLVLALLIFSMWRAWRGSRDTSNLDAPMPSVDAPMRMTAFMMVLMMALHSQLEYPLWYAYFLLPTAFALGLCLGSADEAAREKQPASRHTKSVRPEVSKGSSRTPFATSGRSEKPPQPERGGFFVRPRNSARPLVMASLLMLGGSIASLYDYLRVVVIFSPGDQAVSLAERITEGKRSWFFDHHAHYAAVTSAARPSDEMASFKVASHYLLDTRLMTTWATALNEAGDTPRARAIAQRLIEFRNLDAKPFFEACGVPLAVDAVVPFQCAPQVQEFGYRDFK